MSVTSMNLLVNYVDSDVNYQTTPADFIVMDLTNDYLIWTAGDSIVKDLMTHEPTPAELNAAATVIDTVDTMVALCLLMDYSHNVGGAYYTHLVKGMGLNKRYVFGFSFNGATASEPQLEAWDDSTHSTTAKNVLGAGTPANSFVKAVCTTTTPPGASWVGTAIAGAANVLLLNAGAGALGALGTMLTSQELYANMKIVIPASYATPSVETFISTVRYTYTS